jgi:hypothetical protein
MAAVTLPRRLALAALAAIGLVVGLLSATSQTAQGARAVPGQAAFARSVLAEAPVPPDSTPTKPVPRLERPLEEPGVFGLIDLHRFYGVRLPPAKVTGWLLAHLPPAAKLSATSTFLGPDGGGSGFVVQLFEKSPHAYLAELAYSIIAHRGGSLLRLDAYSVWLAPLPAFERVPKDAVAKVIGYTEVSLLRPASGAVSVVLTASASARLVDTVDSLPASAHVTCKEDAASYQLVLDTPGRRYVLRGRQCARTVEVSLNGHVLQPLHDAACRLARLVAGLVPARAVATRTAAAQCLGLSRSGL